MVVVGLFAALGGHLNVPARGQVAFQPIPGAIFSGSTMTVTPAVSADRRYVRLSVGAYFNALNGFTNIQVPAAVSGGGGLAGMNGVIGGGGGGAAAGGIGQNGFPGQVGDPLTGYRAGGLVLGEGGLPSLGGDPSWGRGGPNGPNAWPGVDRDGAQAWPGGEFAPTADGEDRGIGAAPRSRRGQHRAARKPSRRTGAATQRRSR